MTTLMTLAFWSIIGGAFGVLLIVAIGTALSWRDWSDR